MLESHIQRPASAALNRRKMSIAGRSDLIGASIKTHSMKIQLHTSDHKGLVWLLRCGPSEVTRLVCSKLRAGCLFLAACAISVQVTAQDIEAIETELTAEVRVEMVDSANRKISRYVPATVVSQGDVVYYTLRIRNPSTEYLRNVSVKQRIPANTVYVEDSAAGPGAEVLFSTDGGLTFARREDLRVTDASGAQRTATPEDYTHIQWRLRNALAPGAVALARFQTVFK
jgi:uncharacterized repeat protein (TIGR01451 family)